MVDSCIWINLERERVPGFELVGRGSLALVEGDLSKLLFACDGELFCGGFDLLILCNLFVKLSV